MGSEAIASVLRLCPTGGVDSPGVPALAFIDVLGALANAEDAHGATGVRRR